MTIVQEIKDLNTKLESLEVKEWGFKAKLEIFSPEPVISITSDLDNSYLIVPVEKLNKFIDVMNKFRNRLNENDSK